MKGRTKEYEKLSYCSNSALSKLKRKLLGLPLLEKIAKTKLNFGKEFHRRMEPDSKEKPIKLSETELLNIDCMQIKTLNNTLIKWFLNQQDTKFESWGLGMIDGIMFKNIFDLFHPSKGIGGDYKTTSCQTFTGFLSNCNDFDYWRQAYIYQKLGADKRFYFIGVQKFNPFKIFVVDVNAYPEQMRKAEKEFKWLLDEWKKERS